MFWKYNTLFIPVKARSPFLRGFSAYNYGPITMIHEEKVGNEGLLAHEGVHAAQFYRYLGLNTLLYKFSKKWRLKFEVEAYREQMKYADFTPLFASILCERYNLDITFGEALNLLTRR